MAWELTPAELELTRAKIEKINSRAVKRGFTGRLDVVAEKFEKTGKSFVGLATTETMYRVSVTGEPPKYNGWTLLAALDWSAAGLIVRTAPGVQSVDRTRLVQGKCDHCGTNRQRKAEYVVSDGTREVQVGSTCLKDFLGWSGTVVMLWEEDLDKPLAECWGGVERDYSTTTVLAAAWAVVTTYGFVRAYETGATRDVVATILSPRATREDTRFVREMEPVVAQAAEMGETLRKWVASNEFTGTSEYVQNVKRLCAADRMDWRHLGMVVSVPQARARAQHKTLIAEREREASVNQWLGELEERIEFRAKVRAVQFLEGQWGSTTLYTLVTDDGHLLKWFSSSAPLGHNPTDEYIHLRGRVIAHQEHNGVKSTKVSRCSVVKPKAPAKSRAKATAHR